MPTAPWPPTRADRDGWSTKDKSGCFIGAYAINPINDEKLPIYIADYVLMGTAPARSWPCRRTICATTSSPRSWRSDQAGRGDPTGKAVAAPFIGEGVAVNSPIIDGLPTEKAKEKSSRRSRLKRGVKSVKYKLRDWLFSASGTGRAVSHRAGRGGRRHASTSANCASGC